MMLFQYYFQGAPVEFEAGASAPSGLDNQVRIGNAIYLGGKTRILPQFWIISQLADGIRVLSYACASF